jgi:hypothetical protein
LVLNFFIYYDIKNNIVTMFCHLLQYISLVANDKKSRIAVIGLVY